MNRINQSIMNDSCSSGAGKRSLIFDAFDLEEELFSNSMVVVGAYEMLENVIFIRLKVISQLTFIYWKR